MNQVFNPVFAFKRIFEEEDANRVFSQLSCHPILWELISIENFFASAVRLFGTDLEKWTPKNIIINIDSLADLNDPATTPKQNHDYLPVLMEITDISASIKEIANKRKNKEPWVKILQDFQLDVINEREITRKWGTVFSIYLEEPDERIELEKILIYQSNDEYVFLALLINLYQDKTWISDFLSRNLEFIINHSNTIKKLVFNLEKIGGQHVAHQLVEELLNNPKFGKKIIDCGKSCFSIESPFEKIEKINDFRFLSLFINDTEKANLFELLAKDILEKSLIIKPVKLYNQDLDLDIDDLLSLDFYISVGNQNSVNILNRNSEILRDLFLAFESAESDTVTAREICKHFLIEVKKYGIEDVISSSQYGYLVDPIDIAKLLINTGLEYEAIFLLEKVISYQQNNLNTIKFLAYYSNMLGDHKRAVKYYSTLTALGNITREEKNIFCKSMQYLGMWKEVLLVRDTINSLNVNDELEVVIAAQKANDKKELKDHIDQLLSKYPKDKIAKAINLLFLDDFKENDDFEEQFNTLLKEPNKDIRTIGFIEEYFREKRKFGQILLFLDDLPGKYKHHPEIQLFNYRAQLKVGADETCISILQNLSKSEAIIHQEIIEEIIHELLERNMYSEVKNLLEIYQEKWKLSPIIILANSMVFLDEKEYQRAKEQITMLLDNNEVNEDTVSVFGCNILETSLSDFPYRKSIKGLSIDDKSKFKEFYGQLSDHQSNILINLLNIEICENDRENKYIKLLTDNTSFESKDNWRIPFGLGYFYFREKKFDQAIIYFKEALKIFPTHKIILDLLIKAYSHLKLPGEAIKIIKLQSNLNNLTLTDLVGYSDLLFEYNEFKIFLEDQGSNSSLNPNFQIALAKVLINNCDYKTAEFQLSKIETDKNLDEGYLLALAQCYLDCKDELSSRRVLEKFLSTKNVIDNTSTLESVSIYYQIGEYEKSLNLLRTVKDTTAHKSIIEADILIKLNQIELAINIIEDLLLTEGKIEPLRKYIQGDVVKIPENWELDLPRIYSLAISLRLRMKNYKKANELAIKGAKYFPEQKGFQEIALYICYLEGDTNLNKEYLQAIFESNKGLLAIIAETALDVGQEIIAAKLISESALDDENLHLASIRVRLLARNGQEQEAKGIYKAILAKSLSSDLPLELYSSDDLTNLISHLSLCETAFELGDLSTAFEISKRIHQNLGPISKNMLMYLKIITLMIERNRLNEKLLVKNNIFRVSEEDLGLLDVIIEKDIQEMHQFNDWKIRAEAVVCGDPKFLEKVVELNPTFENIGAIIFSLMTLGRKTEAEKALNWVDKNEEALFVYSLFEINEDPEKALTIMLKILQNGNTRPEYYAVLSKANQILGKYSDSYSAISLALNIWPDEYEWENIAGQLCKEMGNNLAAVSHFRKAESYNENHVKSRHLIDDSIVQISQTNKSDIGEILTNTAKDIPLLIEIIYTLLKEDRVDEIEQFLKKLRKYKLNTTELYIIEAKIAFKNKNFDESKRIIDTVLQKDPFDLEALILKTKIIVEQNDLKSAVLFLDSIDTDKIKNPGTLIIQKAKYLEQISGIDSAIKFLINEQKNSKNNIEVVVFTAQLIFLNGNSNEALKIAEEALNTNSDNSELLSLLGNISMDRGDLDKAIDYMIRSISIDPFQSQKYILLSKMFEARRDYKRAIDILDEGLDVIPGDYLLQRYTGLLLYKQGNFKEAHSVLEKAVKINSKDSDLKQIIRILENSLQIKMNQNPKNNKE